MATSGSREIRPMGRNIPATGPAATTTLPLRCPIGKDSHATGITFTPSLRSQLKSLSPPPPHKLGRVGQANSYQLSILRVSHSVACKAWLQQRIDSPNFRLCCMTDGDSCYLKPEVKQGRNSF